LRRTAGTTVFWDAYLKDNSETLKPKLYRVLDSYNQFDCLSQASMICVKSKKLRFTQMQRCGDMENVRQPMTNAGCIPSTQVFGQMMDDCPVHRYGLQYIVPQIRVKSRSI